MADPDPWRLTREQALWLTGTLAAVALPHATRVPLWITLAFLAMAGWRLAGALRGVPLPGRLVRTLVGLALMGGVYASYGRVFGRDPGVALLVAFAGLKLLETHRERDAFVGILLGYFLVVTHFLYAESLATGAYLFGAALLITATLAHLANPPESLDARRRLGLAATLLLQSLPVALALFVLFPRLPGPLWAMPQDAGRGVTGLSDTMSPGTLTTLGQSGAIAFRVRFDGPVPPPAELYWRGPVLWQTDGRTWGTGAVDTSVPPVLLDQGPALAYEVTLEPHQRRWLFLLDAPTQVPEVARVASDLVATARRPVRERLRYRAASAPDYRLFEITEEQRAAALRLPPGYHPRTRALGEGWSQEVSSPEQRVARALDLLAQGGFTYTLQPPAMPDDPVDQFLFDARRGFCEHFSAAFVVLMRAAQVPARVVTGYQGGEVNPLDDFLVVRQRDAHAWAEVWLEDRGWVRVDPTATVAPDRVERGAEQTLAATPVPFIGVTLDPEAGVYRALRGLRYGLDAFNNWWNQWVLGYGTERQQGLLGRFGIDPRDWRDLTGALAVLAGLPLVAVGLWLARGLRPPADPVQRLYRRFCRRLARHGVVRVPSEGPWDFARRAMGALPDHAAGIAAVTDAYVRLRYGRGDDLPLLRRRLRECGL